MGRRRWKSSVSEEGVEGEQSPSGENPGRWNLYEGARGQNLGDYLCTRVRYGKKTVEVGKRIGRRQALNI